MTLLKWYAGGEINEDREDSNIFISHFSVFQEEARPGFLALHSAAGATKYYLVLK